MILTKAQSTIAKSTKRFRVVCCGRRFGKTTLAALEMIAKAVAKKDRYVCYLAPTYQQARDIIWNELKKQLQPIIITTNEQRLEIIIKTQDEGTSTIRLRGWESVETLRGQKYDFIVLDEVALMRHFWVHWHETIRPTLIDTRGECLFLSTPKGFNHFFDLFNINDSDYISFHFTSYDNPHLDRDELEKAKKDLTEDRFAQEILADFRKQEGLIYKEFSREKHIIEIIPEVKEKIAGQDFGFNNPFAVLVIGIDRDDNFYVIEEDYKSRKTNNEIIEIDCQLDKKYNIQAWYPDPAEPDRIEEMARAGLNCHEVKKDVEAGIDRVKELFKSNRLKIHKNCINLISELETYRYKDKKADQNEPEEPVKEKDHAVDALRYALFSYMPKVEKEMDADWNLYKLNYA